MKELLKHQTDTIDEIAEIIDRHKEYNHNPSEEISEYLFKRTKRYIEIAENILTPN